MYYLKRMNIWLYVRGGKCFSMVKSVGFKNIESTRKYLDNLSKRGLIFDFVITQNTITKEYIVNVY